MIPKVVYNIGIGPNPFPEKWMFCVESWQKIDPTLEQKFIKNEDVSETINSLPTRYREFYNNTLTKTIERADFLKLALLWQNGGMYSDIDM